MRLEPLIETLCAHRTSPEECVRHLLALAEGASAAELARGFRTAQAVSALPPAFAQRLAEALARGPAVQGPGDEPSGVLRALEAEVAALEAGTQLARAGQEESRRLQGRIAALAGEIQDLETKIAAAVAHVEEARRRCTEKRSLLEEVEHERSPRPVLA